jgi:16S rRNA processing protein RimM
MPKSRKKSILMHAQGSGSLGTGEPEFLAVGKLRRPHGVRGEILMSVWTDFPERLKPGVVVFVGDDHNPIHIRNVRWHREDLLIAFDEYPVREDVGLLRNQVLWVHVDDLPSLQDGELYKHQLIGMTVIDDASSEPIGRISEILETGANDVYIVRNEHGSEILLPAIDQVILKIDVENHEIRVHILPGLREVSNHK